MRRIKKKHCKEHSMILRNIFRWVAATDGRVIYYLWSQVFARNICFLFCQTIKVHPSPNAFRMSPKSPLFKWIQFWASSISRATVCLIICRHVQPIIFSIKNKFLHAVVLKQQSFMQTQLYVCLRWGQKKQTCNKQIQKTLHCCGECAGKGTANHVKTELNP